MKRLIVIDAHPAIRVALRSYLENHGALTVVDEAGDAAAAVAKVKLHQPDLVIVDPNMATGDGLGLIRQLRVCCNNLKVLVLTALDDTVYVRKAMEEGVDSFVSKTCELSVVLNTVNSVLAGYQCFPKTMAKSWLVAGQPGQDALQLLSRREFIILQHIAKGFSNKEIADMLFISEKTVSTHKSHVLTKLNMKTSIDLAHYARERNLV